MKILFAIFAVVAILLGIYNGLGIWLPACRPRVKGTDRSYGRLSCAGIGIFLIGWGSLFLCTKHLPKPWSIGLFATTMFGWSLIPLGEMLSRRAAAKTHFVLPAEQPTNWRPTIFFLFGIVFLAVVFYILLPHK
jgi:hypothetical protein